MGSISRTLREYVVRRAQGLCEYCQTSERLGIEMEIDHIVPESDGGETIPENLCLACISCNSRKGSAQTGVDPETQKQVQLFHPRQQAWHEHFRWNADGTTLIGLTPTGRATIAQLQINREVVVQVRARWVRAGWHPPPEVNDHE